MTEEGAPVVDLTVALRERWQIEAGDAEHREIAVRVERHHGRVEPPTVRRLYPGTTLPRDHMRVRDDELRTGDEPGALLDAVACLARHLHRRTRDGRRRRCRDSVGRG